MPMRMSLRPASEGDAKAMRPSCTSRVRYSSKSNFRSPVPTRVASRSASTFNQNGEAVQIQVGNLLVQRKQQITQPKV
jgi:hypothetical protein